MFLYQTDEAGIVCGLYAVDKPPCWYTTCLQVRPQYRYYNSQPRKPAELVRPLTIDQRGYHCIFVEQQIITRTNHTQAGLEVIGSKR